MSDRQRLGYHCRVPHNLVSVNVRSQFCDLERSHGHRSVIQGKRHERKLCRGAYGGSAGPYPRQWDS